MCLLRRKPLFSIFHHPCTWANSPWVTECEASTLDWAANEKCSHILYCTSFWSLRPPSPPFLSSLFHSLLSYPHRRARHCQNQGLAGQGDECCVFKVNRSWFLRVHAGVTACAELLHILKLDLTPCLLWRWNPWQVIILLSHIISDGLSTSLVAKSQLLWSERKKEREIPPMESPSFQKSLSGKLLLLLSLRFSLGYIAKGWKWVF